MGGGGKGKEGVWEKKGRRNGNMGGGEKCD